MLIADLDVRVIDAATGELLRHLTLDPNRDYQPLGRPPGPPPRNHNNPTPDEGSGCPGCLGTSHESGRRDSNPRPSPWQVDGDRPASDPECADLRSSPALRPYSPPNPCSP